jgi:hypothetical protein
MCGSSWDLTSSLRRCAARNANGSECRTGRLLLIFSVQPPACLLGVIDRTACGAARESAAMRRGARVDTRSTDCVDVSSGSASERALSRAVERRVFSTRFSTCSAHTTKAGVQHFLSCATLGVCMHNARVETDSSRRSIEFSASLRYAVTRSRRWTDRDFSSRWDPQNPARGQLTASARTLCHGVAVPSPQA